jgi:hypothetical protein
VCCVLGQFPGEYDPSVTHHFIRLLEQKGLLVRCFTQNIDGLEAFAGVTADKIVQAHGGFSTAHCIACGKEHTTDFVKTAVFADDIPRCQDKTCGALVKPDIGHHHTDTLDCRLRPAVRCWLLCGALIFVAAPSPVLQSSSERVCRSGSAIVFAATLRTSICCSLWARLCKSSPSPASSTRCRTRAFVCFSTGKRPPIAETVRAFERSAQRLCCSVWPL